MTRSVIAHIEVLSMDEMDQSQADNYLKFDLCPQLLKTPADILPDVEKRKSFVEFITEEYFRNFGEFPKDVPLSMLGDFLLLDYIKDKSKKKNDEMQFHTHSQEKRRRNKEFSALSDDLDFFQSRDVRHMDSLKRKAVVSYDND